MELEERLNRRFNYRHFKEDDMPSKETIERILQDAINFVPIMSCGYIIYTIF